MRHVAEFFIELFAEWLCFSVEAAAAEIIKARCLSLFMMYD